MTDLRAPEAPQPPPPHRVPGPRPEVAGRQGIVLLVALVLLAAYSGGWGLLLVIAALCFIVTMHELGHFLTAKWAGMKVTEFFLGIGPKLWSFKRGETEYGIKLVPVVAYVKIIGMNNLEEVDPAEEARSYRQGAFHKRLIVVCAGSAMHFLMVLIALWGLLVFHGGPGGHILNENLQPTSWKIAAVQDGSGAAAAGLQPGDRITVFDGQPVANQNELHNLIQPAAGKTVSLVVRRGDQDVSLTATVGSDNGKGLLGINMEPVYPPDQKVGALAAVPRALQEFGTGSVEVVKGIGGVFSPSGIGSLFSQVSTANDQGPVVSNPGGSTGSGGSSAPSNDNANRPVSIIGIAQIGSQVGFYDLLVLMILVNLFFGIFNLVPLLPLDGGHAAIAIYEKIRSVRLGRPYRADIAKLMPLTYAVVGVMLMIGVSAMYLDIVKPL
jgi:membrane-associated protease RseP (regulator of RpoE activity)